MKNEVGGLGEGESLPLGPADPASRILEALLAVEDERERLELLPSAFEPPAEGELPPEVTHPPGVMHLRVTSHGCLSYSCFSQGSMWLCQCPRTAECEWYSSSSGGYYMSSFTRSQRKAGNAGM